MHINSGIPNHAFFLVATELGGRAWERAGLIWYKTLLALNKTSSFKDMVAMSVQCAGGQVRRHQQGSQGRRKGLESRRVLARCLYSRCVFDRAGVSRG